MQKGSAGPPFAFTEMTEGDQGNPQESAHKRTAVGLDSGRFPERGRFIFSAYCKESIRSEDYLNGGEIRSRFLD